MGVFESARLFAKGILKRLYWLVPTLFLDPFDFAERYFGVMYEPPQWVVWVLLLIGFIIAGTLTYHELKKQCAEAQKPSQLSLKDQLHLLIEEGRNLRILSVTQGELPPFAMAENWRIKVKKFLKDNFGEPYAKRWDAHALMRRKPKQGFTGIATTHQISLWNTISAGVEWLEELQNEIRE